ncbi:complement C1q tumor necrosis factor-related protein 1 [Oncorhynchus masou masou]|uniref:complement C1q tumor necrosis factor-related protein 1 n=1 Tax=Oncorhynchus masou masou TaxID=90313 RepID=UPI0031836CA1
MLGVCLSVLLLLPLASSIPSPSRPPPRLCRRCCDPLQPPESSAAHPAHHAAATPEVHTYINMTILKGKFYCFIPGSIFNITYLQVPDKGDLPPPDAQVILRSMILYAQPSERSIMQSQSCSPNGNSIDYYQALVFDTVFVNLYEHFNMFKGKFYCFVPGIYFFNVNIHTWNFKETYLHLMHNDKEQVILYAQPSERSIMQSQSVMMDLALNDEVWVRLYKRERENAVYSDDVDVYITFNGYLVAPSVQ